MAIGALSALTAAADGLSAQRLKMNTVAENIAHAETTRTPEGGPYRKQQVVFTSPSRTSSFAGELRSARLGLRRTRDAHRSAVSRSPGLVGSAGQAVAAEAVVDRNGGVRMIYDPTHPDADINGYVTMPDIEVITEMVDLMSAQRAYEANLTSVEAVKSMVSRTLDI
ncbi:MAG TPA: flagellar basal body rod protein FlgC [Acidobacteriota bacterium]|nr:flagellar basal body rod protein FlgC [Acidobacteriota bacterium]